MPLFPHLPYHPLTAKLVAKYFIRYGIPGPLSASRTAWKLRTFAHVGAHPRNFSTAPPLSSWARGPQCPAPRAKQTRTLPLAIDHSVFAKLDRILNTQQPPLSVISRLSTFLPPTNQDCLVGRPATYRTPLETSTPESRGRLVFSTRPLSRKSRLGKRCLRWSRPDHRGDWH